MGKNYDCWFCSCGRIHIMESDLFDWLQEKHEKRSVIRVCTNCGANRRVYLTENGEGFDINSFEVNLNGLRTIIDPAEDGNEYKFIFDRGIMVPMKRGGYADYHSHHNHMFINTDYMETTLGTTCINTALQQDPLCFTVDTKRLIKEINDEDIVRSISNYIVGIDWSGTKYERR